MSGLRKWGSKISFQFNKKSINGATAVKLSISRYMVLRGESTPAVIPDQQMLRFKFMLDYSDETISMSTSPLAPGEKIRVIKGPLAGLEGELVHVNGKSKVAVRLTMLGCACVDIPAGCVEPVSENGDLRD